MFGFFKAKKGDVLSHWYSPIGSFNISTKEFYAAVEEELKRRQVPGMDITCVDFSEGGLLSANREYLRLQRERFVFDVCASPFGTSYFFSIRFVELPMRLNIWEWIAFIIGTSCALTLIQALLSNLCGMLIGSILLVPTILLIIWFLRNLGNFGLYYIDTVLYSLPVIGAVYEKFFRPETYFRHDTRLMYLETINSVVQDKITEVTSGKGIRLLTIRKCAPILDDLYRTIQVDNVTKTAHETGATSLV